MTVAGQTRDDSFQEVLRRVSYLVDGAVERLFVGCRRLAKAADLAHELESGGTNFLVADDLVAIT